MKLNLSKSTVYMQTAKNVFSPAQYYTMCIMYTIHVYLYIKKIFVWANHSTHIIWIHKNSFYLYLVNYVFLWCTMHSIFAFVDIVGLLLQEKLVTSLHLLITPFGNVYFWSRQNDGKIIGSLSLHWILRYVRVTFMRIY